jgi:pimeloyl-ACP methyl ester carboxylesterase
MSSNLLSTPALSIGGVVREFLWNWENQQVRVVYETLGEGSPVLLLPAFSSVSMRSEMGELAKLVSQHFQAVVVDWLGFGESSRPSFNYKAQLYHQLLTDFVKSVFNSPITVISAGHAASYVLQLAVNQPSAISKIVLIAPTWRGPLPTMGANQGIASTVRELVRSPIIGQALYKLNTTPSFLTWMYRRHVFVDAAKLTPSFIQQKWQTTQQPGARFGSAAFVTGNLDAVSSQADFLELVQGLSVPLLVVIAQSAPPKSRAEMDALAALPGVKSAVLPGSLGMHEEYPKAIAELILPFLQT